MKRWVAKFILSNRITRESKAPVRGQGRSSTSDQGEFHLCNRYGVPVLNEVLVEVTESSLSISLDNFQVTIDGEESVISLTEEPGAGSCLDGLGESRKNVHR